MDREEVIQMYESGLVVSDIADEMGVPKSAITEILREAGIIQKQGRKLSTSNLTEEERQEVIDSYVNGTTAVSLIAQYGITWNALYRLLEEAGIPYKEYKQIERGARHQRLDRAVEMYQGGARLWEIQNETGIRQPVLHNELHRRGIPLRIKRE